MILYQEQHARAENEINIVKKEEIININIESLSSQPFEHFVVTLIFLI